MNENHKEFSVSSKFSVSGDRSILPSILVIEDDLDVKEAVVETLIEIGVPIVTAENGKEGLEKAINKNICAIITDINMPIMDGL